jgi:hypothetical protein
MTRLVEAIVLLDGLLDRPGAGEAGGEPNQVPPPEAPSGVPPSGVTVKRPRRM